MQSKMLYMQLTSQRKSEVVRGPRMAEDLGTVIPNCVQLVVRNTHHFTEEQRLKVMQATMFNLFAFPAGMVTVDYLSDSGTTSMTDTQWASMFHGDESYGRNHGFYALVDGLRDAFERGEKPRHAVDLFLSSSTSPEDLISFFMQDFEGGFHNGGSVYLSRPNIFVTPQGRCAEHLLLSAVARLLPKLSDDKQYIIPSNGFFDTTEAHAHVNGINPVNCFAKHLTDEFNVENLWVSNPFKGDIDIAAVEELIQKHGTELVPIILLTITNNTAAGQPVSMANIKAISSLAKRYCLPLWLDCCRFAENAYFIKTYEDGHSHRSIRDIVQEIFSYVDLYTISLKKDGLANMGGALAFRDQGVFHTRFSELAGQDVGFILRETQILEYGNDSYGGMSGRDMMAAAVGIGEVMNEAYLRHRINQTTLFAEKLEKLGIPVVLPPGGHAVYVDVDLFFKDVHEVTKGDFMGVGLTIEMLKKYGIRGCELGAFAFEWDQKDEASREGVLNYVRFAIPRNAYNMEHIDYTVAALGELYRFRHLIPKVSITRGAELHLRHFQAELSPAYPQSSEGWPMKSTTSSNTRASVRWKKPQSRGSSFEIL